MASVTGLWCANVLLHHRSDLHGRCQGKLAALREPVCNMANIWKQHEGCLGRDGSMQQAAGAHNMLQVAARNMLQVAARSMPSRTSTPGNGRPPQRTSHYCPGTAPARNAPAHLVDGIRPPLRSDVFCDFLAILVDNNGWHFLQTAGLGF